MTDPSGQPMYRAVGLGRTYGSGRRSVTALSGVDLELERGQRLGLVGESGSGKSTLIRLLAGLDQPSAGEVWFEGNRVDGRPERELGFLRASVQLVFQDPRSSLNPRMCVGDIVTEPLRSRRIRSELTSAVDRRSRLAEVLAAVDLPASAADRYPHEFSGGQRQRIAIARALAPQPTVLIADEPVSALDVSVRAQVLNLLNDLARTQDLTMIVVSHDLSVVRHLCDRLAVLRAGQLVEQGSTSEIYQQPRSEYTRSLLAAAPRINLGEG